MQSIARFAFVRASDQLQFTFDGEPVAFSITGDKLLGQYACRHGFLLIVAESSYDGGEYLRFALVSPQLAQIDQVYFAHGDYFGNTSDEVSDQRVQGELLRFVYGGEHYGLKVLEKPAWWNQEWLSLRAIRLDTWSKAPRYLWFTKLR